MVRQWNGPALRDLREARDWSQQRLAHEAGTDVGTISRLERGKHGPQANTLASLAAALGVVDESVFFAIAEETDALGEAAA
jgi:transcriptional regulator with XRE-family HTH domain